jgi:CelD/BcsL family acetyltransferase involved in cellulose biosynthesis
VRASSREAWITERSCAVAHLDWEALEPLWRALEARGGVSPYQRFDFVAPWLRNVAPRRDMQPLVVEIRIDGRTAMLLPLEITVFGIARIARFPGGRQTNLGGPVVDPDLAAAIDPGQLGDRLVEIATGPLRIDGYALLNQPELPDGIVNPLAMMAESRPSTAVSFRLYLDGPVDDVLTRVLSQGTRRHLVKKRKRLAERGPVRFGPASDAAEAGMMLDTFLRQKAERFAALGLANPFGDEGVAGFLRETIVTGLRDGRPGLEAFGLWCGDRPVAIFGAASSGHRLSGSFICFDADPEVARCSPGELVLVEVIRLAAARGVRVFDLGLGRGPLKARFCKAGQPMVDTMLPATQLGGAALLAIRTAGQLKDLLQRDERLIRPARRLAGWLGMQPRD